MQGTLHYNVATEECQLDTHARQLFCFYLTETSTLHGLAKASISEPCRDTFVRAVVEGQDCDTFTTIHPHGEGLDLSLRWESNGPQERSGIVTLRTPESEVLARLLATQVEDKTILFLAPLIMAYKNLEGKVTRGYGELSRLYGENLAESGKLDQYNSEQRIAEDCEVFATMQPKIGIIERVDLLGSEQERWGLTDKYPVLDATRQGVLFYSRDISDLVAANTRLADSFKDLESAQAHEQAANEELEDFAYATSHDLKAPLRAINALTRWAIKDLGAGKVDDVRSGLETIRYRVGRMESLINGLLDYSRVGKEGVRTEDVNVKEVIDGVIVDIFADYGVGDSKPRLAIDASVPLDLTARVNSHRLGQAVHNLVDNAVKHSDEPDIRIHIDGKAIEGGVRIDVADNGPGIADPYKAKVFGIFETLKPRDVVEGNGMGLSIVKKIAEKSGGSITISDNQPKGCVFTLEILNSES